MVISSIDIISVNYNDYAYPVKCDVLFEIIDKKEDLYGKDFLFFKKIPGTLFQFWPKHSEDYSNEFFDLQFNPSSKKYIVIAEKPMIKTLKRMIRFYLRVSPVNLIAILIKLEGEEEKEVIFLKEKSYFRMVKSGKIEFNRVYMITK